MTNIQRIKYTDKAGAPMDLHLIILKKKSKVIVVKRPCDGYVFEIPRLAIDEITEPVKEGSEEKLVIV
jgi:hypothetical protein